MPATSEGNRTSSGLLPKRVASHDPTKKSGGVISLLLWTVDSTVPRSLPTTIQYVESSSANSASCATRRRSIPPRRVSASTARTGGATRELMEPSRSIRSSLGWPPSLYRSRLALLRVHTAMWEGKRVSAVLMTYAERGSIRRVIEGFVATGVVDEVLVVNNNAEPGTSEEVAQTSAREVLETNQGYGHAVRRGLIESTGDPVVLAEPDATFLPADDRNPLAPSS